MAIPKSYSQSLINARIVNPSVEELQPYFKNLRVKKEYAKTKGNPLKSYIFTFTPEPKDADDYQIKKKDTKSPLEKKLPLIGIQKEVILLNLTQTMLIIYSKHWRKNETTCK